MDSSGGYLFDSASAPRQEANEPNHSHSADTVPTKEVRRLTQKQELRLMNYLDAAFLENNRGFSKR